ncbi:uncharacterized protein LOC132095180 [Carassius carassius]|uniref:uncharacterized protein LOC132095180 n=1 Tax=Carassius carassius TaxID=217509 RepID=UPI002868EEE5|nr:uncharacterized protein LOC132095180 [Carassius carassius]
MADKCHLCLLGLIFLSSLLTGHSGVDDAHVFISSGEDVRLPCNNALHDCNSTTWIYERFSHSPAVELFAGGRKKKNRKGHERLSLGSDCSLNIKSVTKEDCGSYICQQYVNNEQQGTDAGVYLHVLHVSSSQTEISAGLFVTLFCQLYSYPQVSCDYLIRSEGIDLFWVNQAGVKLMRSDSRYQISFSSDYCIISLTTTLLNEDHNREWRCAVTQRDQLQTSVTYTVKISAGADSETAETSVHITDSTTTTSTTSTPENQKSLNTPDFERTAAGHTSGFTDQQVVTSTTETTMNPDTAPISWKEVIVIVVSVSIALLLPALILWLIRKKRDDVRRETDDSVEQTDDMTYIIYCAQ